MRIVIDLQAAQQGEQPGTAAAFALAQELVRTAGAHQVVIALSSRYPASIPALRHAFAAELPAATVVLYDLPAAAAAVDDGARTWLHHVSIALRAAFLAQQDADLVFVPALAPDTSQPPAAVAQFSDAFRGYLRVMQLGTPRATALENMAALASADVLVANSGPAAALWREQLGLDLGPVHDAADAAALWDLFATLLAGRTSSPAGADAPAPAARPRLAYISPLPPEHSGIADYSAELLPELSRYYDVEAIIAQPAVSDAWVEANVPLRSVEWFEQHAAGYDRVLYHFGNSPMHEHMFGLLQRHPGIVVLHDFYLANVLNYMHHTGYQPDVGVQTLFESHGFGALLQYQKIGEVAAVWRYPSNRDVLEQAQGVIVHSDFPKQLAEEWYGPRMAARWHTLPLLRGLANGDRVAARKAARQQLKMDEDVFLVCTFGMLGPTKLNDKLLEAWQQSPLAADKECRLVFVGQLGGENHGRDLPAKIAQGAGKKRIAITGFVTQELYQTYLAACDVAVQLRTSTRGETSAAVLDCLLHGVPTVANAHGSTAELPADVMVKLDDQFELAALSDALLRLRRDPVLRQQLSDAGATHIRAHHAPRHVGSLYFDAIEHIAAHSPASHYQTLLAAVRALGATPQPSLLLATAAAIAANQPTPGPRQFFVDISAMVQTDLKTGIQRVVRSVLNALFNAPPPGYQIEPVYSPGRGEPYRYARGYMQKSLRAQFDCPDDAPIDVRSGDLFLGLDLMMHGTQQNHALLQDYRNRGAHVYFIVYDILPVLRPDVFPFGAEADFASWIDTIATVSDGLVCISRAVADQLGGWLAKRRPARPDPLRLGYFHLGADIDASAPSTGLPPDADLILLEVSRRPTLLIVGTVEPRKGHGQALAAFDLLWDEGVAVNLVIVGKHGWMVDAVAERLRKHPLLGKQLFWLQGASDEMLLKLYQSASGLLVPSEGEGFGLPLIEAAQHGIPIIARDLTVFREVAGEHAYYFNGLTAEDLAATMRTWLKILQEKKVPSSTGMPWLTWADSARQLLEVVCEQRWHDTVAPQAMSALPRRNGD